MRTQHLLAVTAILMVGAGAGAGLAPILASVVADRAQKGQAGPNDIAGTVTGPEGPEPGVWVIAETNELPTKFVRIVVTDDRGRYLIPDLPTATYDVWVRGYGLVDSPKSKSTVGKTVDLKATPAPNARAAAAYYPAGYWLSMLRVPDRSEFPGTGPSGNGVSPNVKSQEDWIRTIKSGGCTACHQLGTLGTRVIPEPYRKLGSSTAAWERRVQSGQAGAQMLGTIDNLGHTRALQLFADWTDRIAAGEVPATAPRRPQGIERNVVITEWDWADSKSYLHDLVSTDRRDPTVNANGPLNRAGRHLAMYDPSTKKLTHISTCFGTHHLMFAEDSNRTLWTSGGGPVIGWLDTKLFEATGDEEKAQGWTALILDTNGDGKRGEYTEPNQPIDPTKDHRISAGFYAVAPAPDGSIWGSALGFPGGILRLVPGSHPPETSLVEYYEPPYKSADPAKRGYSPRGMDIDRNGVAWVALASGHMASFDRRKCKGPLNGPTATGQHLTEGWTLYREPMPQLRNVTASGSAEASYYTWVDQQDLLGLGKNTPINTGNASEALLALKDGQWVILRVPYPTGFYTKWMDGRVDDADAGWKGRGLWATVSTRAPFHMETGKGTTSKVIHFQLRPSPLAR